MIFYPNFTASRGTSLNALLLFNTYFSLTTSDVMLLQRMLLSCPSVLLSVIHLANEPLLNYRTKFHEPFSSFAYNMEYFILWILLKLWPFERKVEEREECIRIGNKTKQKQAKSKHNITLNSMMAVSVRKYVHVSLYLSVRNFRYTFLRKYMNNWTLLEVYVVFMLRDAKLVAFWFTFVSPLSISPPDRSFVRPSVCTQLLRVTPTVFEV